MPIIPPTPPSSCPLTFFTLSPTPMLQGKCTATLGPMAAEEKSEDGCLLEMDTVEEGTLRIDEDEALWDAGALCPSKQFAQAIEEVREAIRLGCHPSLIPQGSSGSYFCRDKSGTIVGVFKPKDEEPYGDFNPKFGKWVQRTLCRCCFGRSCLLPNQGRVMGLNFPKRIVANTHHAR